MFEMELILGIVIGSLISNLFHYLKSGYGVLEIDHSNPEKDSYNFVVTDLDKLNKKTRFMMRIEHRGKFRKNNKRYYEN